MSFLPDMLQVGVQSIDQRHEEFYELFEELKTASNIEFIDCFEAIISHTRYHFAEEEADMVRIGYPNRIEHMAEHQKALEEMEYFLNKAKTGKMAFAKAYARDRLGDWFRNHLLNMDSDLARVMNHNAG